MTYKGGRCGGSFTTLNGIITSPSYPDNYPAYADCIYTISQPLGSVILLNFLIMDINHHDSNCETEEQWGMRENDYLEIVDGPSEYDGFLLDYLRGNDIPAPIQSSQNNLWMK